ncbi:Gfo/Idh/MocA family oxidoreductase [Tundrisphaera sp. TA3]|uniref:Gfo/Idh/MocA family oxidoreductase n=1 Tax=Tundrisphaera sp. TA3 TaxID=3435775 RepID=UPI003EB81B20
MSRRLDRRRFLQAASVAGVGFGVAPGILRGQVGSPNDRLRFACIGVGGKGSSDTDHVAALGDVVGLCDIDANRLDAKGEKLPKAKKYADFRKMLEEMGDQIDAVVVSSPDHTHAPAALMAMRMGKPVYCQKPLAHSPYEARLMREVAAEKKVATQMGNQGTAHPGFRSGIELIRSGVVGPIREVHSWTNRPFSYWKQAPDVVARPQNPGPAPAHVAWDLFLGPAPERPYAPGYHPFAWRGWWDFGTGAMGDMACHTANLAFMALKLGLPTHVSAESGEINPETYPAWATITYDFPGRGDLPPVKLTWYEGARDGRRNLPPAELFRGKKLSDSGSILIGDKGAIYSPSDYGQEQVVLGVDAEAVPKPAEKPKDAPKPNIDADHKAEWVKAIRANDPSIAWSNFGYAGLLTEAMLLGNVAVRMGKAFDYDPATGQAGSGTDANRFIRPAFREGWNL